MHNLNKEFRYCRQNIRALGIRIYPIESVRINTRAKKRLGVCKSSPTYSTVHPSFIIEISYRLLEDDIPIDILHDVLYHEILHASIGAHGHDTVWKKNAAKVNEEYGANITTTYDESLLNNRINGILFEHTEPQYKYEFVCSGCGQQVKRQRASAFTKNFSRYRCSRCGGKFMVSSSEKKEKNKQCQKNH